MTNQVSIKINYPVRFGFISVNRKRTVNLSFDNLALFLFREDNELNDSNDLHEWQKKHNEFDILIHAVFAACKSWHLHNRKPFNFELKKFALGFAEAKKEDIEKVIEVWKRSQSYGAAELPGKKKAKVKV